MSGSCSRGPRRAGAKPRYAHYLIYMHHIKKKYYRLYIVVMVPVSTNVRRRLHPRQATGTATKYHEHNASYYTFLFHIYICIYNTMVSVFISVR